jgi:DNA-binding FadR family transcriptional regulator
MERDIMDQVRRTPLADQAAELLLDRIRSAEWALGQKLPSEATLGPQLGVGRSTVREAIRKLAGRGVLASRQGAGVFVMALDAPADWDTVLRDAGIIAVIEARMAIEAESAGLAAKRRTAADLTKVRRALRDRNDSRGDRETHVDSDTAFHRSIIVAAHNPILTDIFDGLTPRLRHAMIEMLRIRGAFGSDEDQDVHARLAQAVADRDSQLAFALSRGHLLSLKNALT